jgi:hypothetical protein
MTHVLLILVDAMRADHLGCYAGKDMGTPNVDELARQGVVFQNAISQASWTRPSTASIMTGLYPSQNGLGGRWSKTKEGKRIRAGALDPSIPTLAEILTAAGHTTAFLGGNANLKPLFGITRGFTHNLWRFTNDGSLVVEDFERWLQSERPESSFSYIHFMDVHNPLPVETIPARLDTGLDLDLVKESRNELMSYYAAAVRRADQHVGRVVRSLESAGILEDTLIIVSADHGEELGEHGGMLSHGRSLYRELVRVPLVVRLPGRAFAGERIEDPVELIDVLPTTLDQLGCPPADVPGQSLLPLIRGEEANGAPAFSEFLKPDRYGQSVTTRTYQYIQSYRLEDDLLGDPADLVPGLSVQVKGQPIQGSRFMATKVLMKHDYEPTVCGTVEQLDAASGSVTVMGITCRADQDTRFVGKEQKPLTLDELAVGDRITLSFDAGSDGQYVANRIKQKALGGKSKLEGPIERAQIIGDGLRSITVQGTDVLIDENVKVRTFKDKDRKKEMPAAVDRILTGDFIEMHRELYDIASDPAQTRNIVDERPDVAQELEELLAVWTQSLAGRVHAAAGSVDMDPETMDQLRRMGYIE